MTISSLPRLLPLALLALASCSSSPTTGMPDGGKPDGGEGGGDAGSDAGDAGNDAGPLRTATTRGLLGTATRSVLLDPFVTTDLSLGHFQGILFPVMGTTYDTLTIRRAFVSQAPAGVAVPVASFPALSGLNVTVTSLEVVAPFTGGADPFNAQIWVSAGDATGAPVAFDVGGKGITVSLLPNDLPTQTYPLARDGAPPLVFAGRQWVRFALASPAPLLQGGWFEVTVADVNATVQLQAPEVTPTATGPVPPPPPHRAPRPARASAALTAYAERIRQAR